MNFKSDRSYMAIGKQVDANTSVIPDIFVPYMEEDLGNDPANERVPQIVGINWKSNLVLQGERKSGGKIKCLAHPDLVGYFLDMTIKKDSTSGDGILGYTHTFNPDTAEYYTIDIMRGNYVERFVGCQISKIGFMKEGANIAMEMEAMGSAVFNCGTLKGALVGATTTIEFSEDYDPYPANGLVIGDIINVYNGDTEQEAVITSVASDKKSVDIDSISLTADDGALITIKEQTPSYGELQRPYKFGQMLVGIGVDETEATANASTYANATPTNEVKMEIDSALEEHYSSGSNNPRLLEGTPDMTLNIKRLYEKADDVQNLNDITKRAITIIFTGDSISSGVYTTLIFKLYNVKSQKAGNSTKAGEYIFDETDFFVEYDNSDAKAVEVILKNKVEII